MCSIYDLKSLIRRSREIDWVTPLTFANNSYRVSFCLLANSGNLSSCSCDTAPREAMKWRIQGLISPDSRIGRCSVPGPNSISSDMQSWLTKKCARTQPGPLVPENLADPPSDPLQIHKRFWMFQRNSEKGIFFEIILPDFCPFSSGYQFRGFSRRYPWIYQSQIVTIQWFAFGEKSERCRGPTMSHEDPYMSNCDRRDPFLLCGICLLIKLLELTAYKSDSRSPYESFVLPDPSDIILFCHGPLLLFLSVCYSRP
jgi:hypothetical protein